MTDPSNNAPMEFDRGDPTRRCTAKRSDRSGEQCRKWAIRGGTTCATHGSGTKAAKRKARERLELAADRMARQLLRMATDENVSDAVKLNAIRDCLDRAGVQARTAVAVEVSAAPYQTILESIETGSRAEYRRVHGIADDTPPPPAVADRPRELAAADQDAPIDAEIVDEGAELIAAMRRRRDDEHAPADDSAPGINPLGGPLGASGPAGGGMMTLEDAVAAQAEMRRTAVRRAEGQRALPRGWPE
jgi:hypothetical protein